MEKDIILPSPPSTPTVAAPTETGPAYNPKRLTAYMISVELTNFEFAISENASWGQQEEGPPSPAHLPRPKLSWIGGMFSRSTAGSGSGSGASGSYLSAPNASGYGGGGGLSNQNEGNQPGDEIADWFDVAQVAEVGGTLVVGVVVVGVVLS